MQSRNGILHGRRVAQSRTADKTVLPIVQALEDRRLLSVSAHNLVGPLAAGDTYTYKHLDTAGGFDDVIVVGPTTFNGQNVTEIDTYTSPSHSRAPHGAGQGFSAFDAAGQYLNFGTIVTDDAGNATSTVTYTPGNVLFPAELNAGQTYMFTWSRRSSPPISAAATWRSSPPTA